MTVYEGRREFRELERAARRAGYSKKRAPEYVPYRMLEVEAAANAVYAWAGEQILTRRLPEERPSDPAEYAAAVRHEHQALRHRAHHKLMQAFLEPEIFDGAVTLTRPRKATGNPQLARRGTAPRHHPKLKSRDDRPSARAEWSAQIQVMRLNFASHFAGLISPHLGACGAPARPTLWGRCPELALKRGSPL